MSTHPASGPHPDTPSSPSHPPSDLAEELPEDAAADNAAADPAPYRQSPVWKYFERRDCGKKRNMKGNMISQSRCYCKLCPQMGVEPTGYVVGGGSTKQLISHLVRQHYAPTARVTAGMVPVLAEDVAWLLSTKTGRDFTIRRETLSGGAHTPARDVDVAPASAQPQKRARRDSDATEIESPAKSTTPSRAASEWYALRTRPYTGTAALADPPLFASIVSHAAPSPAVVREQTPPADTAPLYTVLRLAHGPEPRGTFESLEAANDAVQELTRGEFERLKAPGYFYTCRMDHEGCFRGMVEREDKAGRVKAVVEYRIEVEQVEEEGAKEVWLVKHGEQVVGGYGSEDGAMRAAERRKMGAGDGDGWRVQRVVVRG